MEVAENIYQIKTAVPGNGPGMMNAYLFKTPEGAMLVDTGWNNSESFDSLTGQLGDAGVSLEDVRFIVITHTHPDHYGMMHRLASQTSTQVIIHEQEQAILQLRADNYEKMAQEMATWLEAHDMPGDLQDLFDRSSISKLGMVPVNLPVWTVRGGERFSIGDFEFEIIWTPGHSPGHICLYEARRKVLVAGDHILPDTTPNVSMYLEAMENPLAQYMRSLEKMRPLDVRMVLPSHGEIFDDLPGRIDAILRHHEGRLAAMQLVLADGERTARQVAEATPWVEGKVAWGDLNFFSRRMALTETVSHLELLRTREEVIRNLCDGRYGYALNNK